MERRTFRIRTTLVTALAVALVSQVAGAAPRLKEVKDRVVGTDDADDWGPPSGTDGGKTTGQDLVKASIGMETPDTLRFTMHFSALPETIPTTTQYFWAFDVGGDEENGYWMLTSCAPQCESAEAGSLPFQLQHCVKEPIGVVVVIIQTSCSDAEVVQAAVDPIAGTVAIPVDVGSIGAKPGSVIGPEPQLDPKHVRAITRPAEFYVNHDNVPPLDTLQVIKSFILPR